MDTVAIIVIFLMLFLWCAVLSAVVHGLRQDVNENGKAILLLLDSLTKTDKRILDLECKPNPNVDIAIASMKRKRMK